MTYLVPLKYLNPPGESLESNVPFSEGSGASHPDREALRDSFPSSNMNGPDEASQEHSSQSQSSSSYPFSQYSSSQQQEHHSQNSSVTQQIRVEPQPAPPPPPPPPPQGLAPDRGRKPQFGVSEFDKLTKKNVQAIPPVFHALLLTHFDIPLRCGVQERVDRLFWCLKDSGVQSSGDIERYAASLLAKADEEAAQRKAAAAGAPPPPTTKATTTTTTTTTTTSRPVLGAGPSVVFNPHEAHGQQKQQQQQRQSASSFSAPTFGAPPHHPSFLPQQRASLLPQSQVSPPESGSLSTVVMRWVDLSELTSTRVVPPSAPWVTCARSAAAFSDEDAVVLLHPLRSLMVSPYSSSSAAGASSSSGGGTSKSIVDICRDSARALVSPDPRAPAPSLPSLSYASDGFAPPRSSSSGPFSSVYPVLLLRRDGACRQSFGLQLLSVSPSTLFSHAPSLQASLPPALQYVVVTRVGALSPAALAYDVVHSAHVVPVPPPPRGVLVGDVLVCVRGRSVLGGPDSLPLSAADVEIELELAGRECVVVVAARASDEGEGAERPSRVGEQTGAGGGGTRDDASAASEDDEDPIIVLKKKPETAAGGAAAIPPISIKRPAAALAWAIERQRRIREDKHDEPSKVAQQRRAEDVVVQNANEKDKGVGKLLATNNKIKDATTSASATAYQGHATQPKRTFSKPKGKAPRGKIWDYDAGQWREDVPSTSSRSSRLRGSSSPRASGRRTVDESSDESDSDESSDDDKKGRGTTTTKKNEKRSQTNKTKRNTCADFCEGMIVQIHTDPIPSSDDEYGVVVKIRKKARKGGNWVIVEREEGEDLKVRPWQLQIAGEDYHVDSDHQRGGNDAADDDDSSTDDESPATSSSRSRAKTNRQQQQQQQGEVSAKREGETFHARGRSRPPRSANDILSAFEAEGPAKVSAAKGPLAASTAKSSLSTRSDVAKKGAQPTRDKLAVVTRIFTVDFPKGRIGLNLEAISSSTGLGSHVRALYENTPAEACGFVEKGDRVRKVNKRDVTTATHVSIVSLIKAEASVGPVTLELSREVSASSVVDSTTPRRKKGAGGSGAVAASSNKPSSTEGFTTPEKAKAPSRASAAAEDKKKKKKLLSMSPTPHPKFEVGQRVKVNFNDSWFAAFITNRWVVRGLVGDDGVGERSRFVYSIRYEHRVKGTSVGVDSDNIDEDNIVDATIEEGGDSSKRKRRGGGGRGGSTSSQGSASSADANEWRPCICGKNHHQGKQEDKFYHADTTAEVGSIYWLQVGNLCLLFYLLPTSVPNVRCANPRFTSCFLVYLSFLIISSFFSAMGATTGSRSVSPALGFPRSSPRT